MFIDGGVPVVKHPNHRPRHADPGCQSLAEKFGFDVIGCDLVMVLRNLTRKWPSTVRP